MTVAVIPSTCRVGPEVILTGNPCHMQGACRPTNHEMTVRIPRDCGDDGARQCSAAEAPRAVVPLPDAILTPIRLQAPPADREQHSACGSGRRAVTLALSAPSGTAQAAQVVEVHPAHAHRPEHHEGAGQAAVPVVVLAHVRHVQRRL